MSLVPRKPVVDVSDQVRHKLFCAATETSQSLENSDIESRMIILFRRRTTKALISLRMRRLISAFVVRICKTRFSRDAAHIRSLFWRPSCFVSLRKLSGLSRKYIEICQCFGDSVQTNRFVYILVWNGWS